MTRPFDAARPTDSRPECSRSQQQGEPGRGPGRSGPRVTGSPKTPPPAWGASAAPRPVGAAQSETNPTQRAGSGNFRAKLSDPLPRARWRRNPSRTVAQSDGHRARTGRQPGVCERTIRAENAGAGFPARSLWPRGYAGGTRRGDAAARVRALPCAASAPPSRRFPRAAPPPPRERSTGRPNGKNQSWSPAAAGARARRLKSSGGGRGEGEEAEVVAVGAALDEGPHHPRLRASLPLSPSLSLSLCLCLCLCLCLSLSGLHSMKARTTRASRGQIYLSP